MGVEFWILNSENFYLSELASSSEEALWMLLFIYFHKCRMYNLMQMKKIGVSR